MLVMIKIHELPDMGPFTQHAHRLNDGDHLVHFYEDKFTLIDSVSEYIVPSITRGEGIIIIATAENRNIFNAVLERRAIDVTMAKATGQLQIFDAADTLKKFMSNGVPNPIKFRETIGRVIEKMQEKFPRVRAYGEMVNLLWHDDNIEATIQLEHLWNELTHHYDFSLFCGYAMNENQKQKKGVKFNEICCSHTHVISHSGDLKMIELA